MPKQTMCADDPFLLGELLHGAGEYATRSKNHADHEDRFMVELAREQIPQLRLALRKPRQVANGAGWPTQAATARR
jgi:hypothetical protein